MTLVPPTTNSKKTLGLTLIWRPLLAIGSQVESMPKLAAPKNAVPLNGAVDDLSIALTVRCLKCTRAADVDAGAEGVDQFAESSSSSKWSSAKSNEWHRLEEARRRVAAKTTPPMITEKHMPKARIRNEPTTALFKPAMHRKCKKKSKSNTESGLVSASGSNRENESISKTGSVSGLMSISSPTAICAGLRKIKHHDALNLINLAQSKPKLSSPKTSTTATATSIAGAEQSRLRMNGGIKKKGKSVRCKLLIPFPSLGATSFVTLLTIICIETVLLSTMSSCAKTFYMHWNTSNSIFRIDNTDHIIDVNKGNLAFEFDQVHIICPVYEPGAFENETEKYIIYNVSKVEYETCRITNADPRVIAICDKPQKLMFFTITFRPFTPQPGGLEFLPGNDYYFISTSSKDDLYRRIGGRCSTNNMKVVFKVCCAAEEKNKTTESTLVGNVPAESGAGAVSNGVDNTGVNLDMNMNINSNHGHGHNGVNTIGLNGANSGNFMPAGGAAAGNGGASGSGSGVQLKPISGMGTSINTNIDQFNRIPIQPNIIGNNIGAGGVPGVGLGGSGSNGAGIMLSPGHGTINMLPPGRGGVHMGYPGHHHIQTGIRINNVPTQPNTPHTHHKGNVNVNSNDDHQGYEKHPNEVVKNEELTYNSGSHMQVNVWSWVWSWLPGQPGASMRASYGINSTTFGSIIMVIAVHYLLGIRIGNNERQREVLEGFGDLR